MLIGNLKAERDSQKDSQDEDTEPDSIEERPTSVEIRHQFGHWEGDSLVSRKSTVALNSLVERKSRLLMLTKLKRKSMDATSRLLLLDYKVFLIRPDVL